MGPAIGRAGVEQKPRGFLVDHCVTEAAGFGRPRSSIFAARFVPMVGRQVLPARKYVFCFVLLALSGPAGVSAGKQSPGSGFFPIEPWWVFLPASSLQALVFSDRSLAGDSAGKQTSKAVFEDF